MASPDELIVDIMTSPDVRADPYPLYRELRERTPIHRSEVVPAVYLSRFADCHAVLRDNRLGKAGEPKSIVPGNEADPDRIDDGRRRSMLFLDPPDHTRLRGLVSRGFTPRRVAQLRPAIGQMTDSILDRMADEGSFDLIETLAFPLPMKVISELVGMPQDQSERFRPNIDVMARTLEPTTTREEMAHARDLANEVATYVLELAAQRSHDQRDDLISALVEVRDGSDRLSELELVSTVLLLYAAGFETTANLLGNGVHLLMSHPDQMDRLRADPTLIPTAVEEMLRFEAPIQLDVRRVHEPSEVAGVALEPGENVVTLLGGANRDPAKIDDPETFDVGRADIPILSFGSGIHHCLGAALARLEGQVVIRRLLDRFDTIEPLDDHPVWRNQFTFRGLESLNVSVS